MVASRKPGPANTSPATSSSRWRVSPERTEGGVHANRQTSRGRGTVVCGGLQRDNGIPPPWPPLGPENESEGGCGEEPHQEEPHGNRHRITHCDGTRREAHSMERRSLRSPVK